MSKTYRTFLALAAAGLLAVGGLATSVAADGGDRDDKRESMRERMEERREHREDRRERAEDFRERYRDYCVDDVDDLNDTEQEKCMKVRGFFVNATHARREGAALHGAIAALERQIGRLEVREMRLEERLAAGNFTGNETAESIQELIDRIEDAQARLADKLDEMEARMAVLHAKWVSVREHVAERRHHGGDWDDGEEDDEDDEDEDDHESVSSSSSAAA